MDWTFMSFQKCSDWKTSGIFEGFIGNFKTLLRISSSCRIHILFSPNTNFCLTRSIAALRVGGHRLDRQARIQFGRVHFGVFSTSLSLRHSARIGPDLLCHCHPSSAICHPDSKWQFVSLYFGDRQTLSLTGGSNWLEVIIFCDTDFFTHGGDPTDWKWWFFVTHRLHYSRGSQLTF